MIDIEIRCLISSDANIIQTIHKENFQDSWSEEFFYNWINNQEQNKNLKKYGYAAITRTSSKDILVGFILGSSVLDQNEIITFAICKEFQKKRIAKALLEHYLEQIKCQCYLEVARSNERAIALYQQQGFNVLNIRKDYYRIDNNYIDALVMVRNFSSQIKQ